MYAIVFGRAGTPAPPFCPRPQRGTASRSMTDKLAFTRRVPSSTPQYGRGHETPIREERLTPDIETLPQTARKSAHGLMRQNSPYWPLRARWPLTPGMAMRCGSQETLLTKAEGPPRDNGRCHGTAKSFGVWYDLVRRQTGLDC